MKEQVKDNSPAHSTVRHRGFLQRDGRTGSQGGRGVRGCCSIYSTATSKGRTDPSSKARFYPQVQRDKKGEEKANRKERKDADKQKKELHSRTRPQEEKKGQKTPVSKKNNVSWDEGRGTW